MAASTRWRCANTAYNDTTPAAHRQARASRGCRGGCTPPGPPDDQKEVHSIVKLSRCMSRSGGCWPHLQALAFRAFVTSRCLPTLSKPAQRRAMYLTPPSSSCWHTASFTRSLTCRGRESAGSRVRKKLKVTCMPGMEQPRDGSAVQSILPTPPITRETRLTKMHTASKPLASGAVSGCETWRGMRTEVSEREKPRQSPVLVCRPSTVSP